jgi:hypothetical protein
MDEEHKKIFRILAIVVIIVAIGYGIVFLNNQLTGKVSLELESTYEEGVPLEGKLKLSLKEGELIPANSKIIFENNGDVYEYELKEIVSNELVTGNFYIEGGQLSGSGEGIGLKGSKEIYPVVSFTLDILKESSSSEEVQEEVVEEEVVEEEVEEVVEEKEKKEKKEKEVAPITGNVISGFFGGIFNSFLSLTGQVSLEISSQVNGEVSVDNEYVYDLSDGESVELVSGSVSSNSEQLSDGDVDVKVQGNKVTVTTDYIESEEGFGEDYIGSDSQEISIDLSSINLNTESGDLKVSLVYGSEEIVALVTSLVEGEEVSVETEDVEKTEEVEEKIEEITNTTLENVTISKNVTETEVSNDLSEEEINVLTSEFGDVSVEITNAERSENGVVVKSELGNYWVEHYYSPEISDEKLYELVEEDKIKFLKDLSKKLLEQETSKERIDALIG